MVSGISVLGFNTAGTSGTLRNTYTLASVLDYDALGKRDLTQRLDQRESAGFHSSITGWYRELLA